jgi:hypothetical protein
MGGPMLPLDVMCKLILAHPDGRALMRAALELPPELPWWKRLFAGKQKTSAV